MAVDELPRILEITGSLLITETTNEARLDVAQAAGVRRVQWSANLETRTCALCRYLDGKVFEAKSAPWNPPAHINCDCIWIAVEDDEVGDVDAFDPADPALADLVDSHGHFLTNPEKYQPLRIPSAPGGRDFVAVRKKVGDQVITEIRWNRPRYDVPGLRPGTVETGVAERGPKWRPLGEEEPPDGDGGSFLPPLPTPPAPTPPGTLSQADLGDDDLNPDLRFEVPPIDRALPEYIAALEDVPAAETWARERFPGKAFDFAETHIDAIRPTLAQFERLADEWPSVLDRVEYLGTGRGPDGLRFVFDDHVFAESGDGKIRLNPDYYGNPEFFLRRKIRRSEDAWLHDGAGSISETMTHEWGHELHERLKSDSQFAARTAKFEADNRKNKDFTDNAQEDWTGAEAFAEAFAMRYHPGTEAPQEYVRAFNRMLEEFLDEGVR